MQWVIDAWSGDGTKPTKVLRTPDGRYKKDETSRMSYCVICQCVWETDRDVPRYIQKYRDFPTIGIKKKECKYCEED